MCVVFLLREREPGVVFALRCLMELETSDIRSQTSDFNGIAVGDDFYKNAWALLLKIPARRLRIL